MRNWFGAAAAVLLTATVQIQAHTRMNVAADNVAPAAKIAIRSGTFDSVNGRGWSGSMEVTQEGDSIWVSTETGRLEYRRQSDGSFHYVDPRTSDAHGMKIVDPRTIETFYPDDPAEAVRFVRRADTGRQELREGRFKSVDPRYSGEVTLARHGNRIVNASHGTASEYHPQPDGTFHYVDPYTDQIFGLRIVNRYTVEMYRPGDPAVARMMWVGDASAGYAVQVLNNERELERLRDVEELEQAEIAAEEEARQAEMAAQQQTNRTNVMQGFMKGLSEATATNQAMEQSMQDAADRGLAQGAAEYARRRAEIAREEAEQRRADAEYAREVREQEEAARQDRLAAEQARLAEAERARKVQLAANSDSSNSADVGSAGKAGDAEALSEKGVRVWLAVPMKWKEGNTINPQCFSNIFTVNIAYDPKGWGNAGRMNEAVGSLKSSFLAKCSQHGQTDGSVEWYAEGISNQFERQRQHPQDYLVDM